MRSHPTAVVVICLMIAGGCADVSPDPRDAGPIDLSAADPLIAELLGELTAAVTDRPEDVPAWSRLAMACQANGLLEQAEHGYRRVLALDGERPRTWYRLAHVLARRGALPEAVVAADRALAIDDAPASVWASRGRWQLELGRLDDADASFDRAAALAPASVLPAIGRARVALQRGDSAAAVALLEPLVERDPADGYLAHLLGTALHGVGRHDEASELQFRADGAVPQADDPWLDELDAFRTGYDVVIASAQRLIVAGDGDGALAQLDQLRMARPEDVVVLNTVASAQQTAGRLDEAAATLQRAVELHPAHDATHLNRSGVLLAQGDLEAALAAAERAVELNPALGPAQLQLGRIHIRRGAHADAVDALAVAIERGVDDPNVRLLRAQLLEHLQRWSDALIEYERIVERRPASASGHLGMARMLAERGRIEEAERHLERAGTLDPPANELALTVRLVREASR